MNEPTGGKLPSIDELIAAAPGAHGVLIAGPGAGKSFNIGLRVDSLVEQGVTHDEIVLLTLTNETARTLRGRFPVVPVRTVHAYALTALNRIGAATGKRVADRWETAELVGRDTQLIAKEWGFEVRLDRVRKYLRKLGMGFREDQDDEADLTDEDRLLRRAWGEVRAFLLLRVFEEFAPDLVALLEEGREMPDAPRAVVVDEYQDLTPIELRLIHEISRQTGAGVFACGDDRQSIYGFRGADPLALNRFPAVYGIDGPTYLHESRRCPASVVRLAEALADRMPTVAGFSDRPRMTSQEDRGEGEFRVLTLPSVQSEARWLLADIVRRREADRKKSTAVIVARDLRVYVAELNDASDRAGAGLRFVDSRTPLGLGQDPGFRLAYALVRLADELEDQIAWRTLLAVAHGVGRSRIAKLYRDEANRLATALRSLAPLDASLRAVLATGEDTARVLLESEADDQVTGAIDAAAERLGAQRPNWDAIRGMLAEPPSADEEITATRPEEPWRALLAACRRAVHEIAADSEPDENEVLVYTIHAAKGQEWDHEYLAGAYEHGYRDRGGPAGEGLRRL